MVFCNNFLGHFERDIELKSHNPYFNRWFSAISFIDEENLNKCIVTILILIDGFLQCKGVFNVKRRFLVTILILIDGFLQCRTVKKAHNHE